MKTLASTVLVLLFALPSFASPVWLVTNGVLVGAQHVAIGQDLYTVMFVDGTCLAVFSNCDPNRFAFHDLTAAKAAGQVLIDQILIDSPNGAFHTHPATVGGCEGAETPGFERQCAILTPYAVDTPQGLFYGSYAVNGSPVSYIYTQTLITNYQSTDFTGLPVTFALWRRESAPISMDFDGNGYADILMRADNGDLSIWMMDSTGKVSDTSLGNIPTEWKIGGSGDFNGDGKADILWRNISGEVAIWFMNGAQVQNWASLGTVSTEWTLTGIRDFDRDGNSDILWQDSGGTIAVWKMDGATLLESKTIGTAAGRVQQ